MKSCAAFFMICSIAVLSGCGESDNDQPSVAASQSGSESAKPATAFERTNYQAIANNRWIIKDLPMELPGIVTLDVAGDGSFSLDLRRKENGKLVVIESEAGSFTGPEGRFSSEPSPNSHALKALREFHLEMDAKKRPFISIETARFLLTTDKS